MSTPTLTEKPKFRTVSATIDGALCGEIWMPQVKATLPLNKNLRSEFERFSTSDISFRDCLLHILNENGGDFQSASFTADTTITVERVAYIAPGRTEMHTRTIEVSQLKDCADLVDADTYSTDFIGED